MLDHMERRKEEWADLLHRLEELGDDLGKRAPGPPGVWTRHAGEIVVELTRDQVDYINRPLRGQGGYQSFLSHLQDNLSGNLLRLTRADCEKIVRYATQYGEGGFQGRLRSIVDLARLFMGGR